MLVCVVSENYLYLRIYKICKICDNKSPMIQGGQIITLVGQSGSGKTTQIRELVAQPEFRICPSFTTRQPRTTDLPHEYHYVNHDEHGRLVKIPGRFLWDTVTGNGGHYSKDICDVMEALTDPDHMYVNAL